MGKIINFPEKKRKTVEKRLPPDFMYRKFEYTPLPEVQTSLTLVCDELEATTGLAVYQIAFDGSEDLLRHLMCEVKGMAQRISTQPNIYIVVVPQSVNINVGLKISAEMQTGTVKEALALGPP